MSELFTRVLSLSNIFNRKSILVYLNSLIVSTVLAANGQLELSEAIDYAQSNDPWLSGNQSIQDSIEAQSNIAAILPDPKVIIAASNFPLDTFDFNQEPMTQLNVGITQMFPRGDSRAIDSRQKRELAGQFPYLRSDRKQQVELMVSSLWLDAYKAQKTIDLIHRDRFLFDQMVGLAETSYSSGLTMSSQQDVIGAQLGLTRLDDRLTRLNQELDTSKQQLTQWISHEMANQTIAGGLPDTQISADGLLFDSPQSVQQIKLQLLRHPALMAFDKKIQSAQTGVDLARQKYKPQWGLTTKYGYRGQAENGLERADFISFGIVFDLPMFNRARQDNQVRAAASATAALKMDKDLLFKQMYSQLQTSISQLRRYDQRIALYKNQMLPQMSEQAEVSLIAYDNDDGDFVRAVNARIDELNAKIELININVEREKLIARLNYLLTDELSDADIVLQINGVDHG